MIEGTAGVLILGKVLLQVFHRQRACPYWWYNTSVPSAKDFSHDREILFPTLKQPMLLRRTPTLKPNGQNGIFLGSWLSMLLLSRQMKNNLSFLFLLTDTQTMEKIYFPRATNQYFHAALAIRNFPWFLLVYGRQYYLDKCRRKR